MGSRKKVDSKPNPIGTIRPSEPPKTGSWDQGNRKARRNNQSQGTGMSKLSSRHTQEHLNKKYKAKNRRIKMIAKLSRRYNRGR